MVIKIFLRCSSKVGVTWQQGCQLPYPWISFVACFKGEPIVTFFFLFVKLIKCTLISDHIWVYNPTDIYFICYCFMIYQSFLCVDILMHFQSWNSSLGRMGDELNNLCRMYYLYFLWSLLVPNGRWSLFLVNSHLGLIFQTIAMPLVIMQPVKPSLYISLS